jgi:hypothetical protein
MAIKLVTGVPGSGKSYYAVNHILTKYFEWNDELDTYESIGQVVIITDIEGLRLEHYTLDYMLERYQCKLEEFFTVPVQERLTEDFPDHHIVYLLDEIQRRFPAGYRNTDVLYYFQWHRHLGHDVYLMAQTSESVCKHIVALIEFEIKAVRESVKLGKVFKYYFMAGDLKVDEKTIPHNKKVFGLYKSFKKDDQGDKPKPLKKLIVSTVIVVFCMIGLCYCSYRGIRGSIAENIDTGQSQSANKPQINNRLKQLQRQTGSEGNAPRSASGREADASPGSVAPSVPGPVDLSEENLHLIQCGGLWVGRDLVAVQLFGKLIHVRDLPYAIAEDVPGAKVQVLVPGDVLAQVKTILPAGSRDLYRGGDGRLHSVGHGQQLSARSTAVNDGEDDNGVSSIDPPANGYYTVNRDM